MWNHFFWISFYFWWLIIRYYFLSALETNLVLVKFPIVKFLCRKTVIVSTDRSQLPACKFSSNLPIAKRNNICTCDSKVHSRNVSFQSTLFSAFNISSKVPYFSITSIVLPFSLFTFWKMIRNHIQMNKISFFLKF